MKQIIERLKWVLADRNESSNSFAIKAGLSPSNFRKMLMEEQTITEKTLSKIEEAHGINSSWLKNGEGEPYINKDLPMELPSNSDGIPYYDVENFECGSPAGFGGALEVAKPDGYFQFPWLKPDGNTWCVRAHGNSMLNRADPSHSICHGAWVAMRRSNVRTIQWGEVYALATADGYIIKKLLPSDHDGMIRCVSFNEEDGYLPFDLSVSEIYDYAIIVGVATINLW